MFKMRCGIPNAYILDITMYKMHVSLCSYCTIRIPISKTLTGTHEGGYTYVFEMCCYRQRWILLYILLLIIKYIYISVKALKTLKNYTIMLRLVSDIFPMLMLCS